jgi:hypothetical protein
MFCSQCGSPVPTGAAFCEYCGKPLSETTPGTAPGYAETIALSPVAPTPQRRSQRQLASGDQVPMGPQRSMPGKAASADPRKQQIRALRLQLRQLRLELRQVNMQLQQIRTQHSQGAPFVPWGIANRIYREVENIQLSGPQQRKQQLQQEILTLEQQILALESQT